MNDVAEAQVVPWAKDGDTTLGFKVTVQFERDGEIHKAVTSKVRVSLRMDTYLEAAGEVPEQLARFAVARLGDDLEREQGSTAPAEEEILAALTAGQNAYAWKWNIPYPYCHFTERIQMSGYLRLMEEGKDRFVADRGISIKTLLDDRRWIPVVPRSDIRVLDEALMEEDLYTAYTVEEVFKDFTYTSRMDWYVLRDGKLVKTATGRIVHGYALIENHRDWRLVNFDQHVLNALHGKAPKA
ncbi:thioesterase family protein [Streptomyces sp. MST-110588]|uniref:thioesterase family protein n=1 Tax=Streptomyces sp. MST-110588 TaxID=2833628 RepID=UPI001F5E2B47|nr:thioesterase family protein [Streptomyces sp. MST-110588]